MEAILMSIVLILFALMLIYIVSCLLRSVKKGEKSIGYLVIPIKSGAAHIGYGVKRAFWDEAFKEEKARSIILLKTEPLDSETLAQCERLAESYKLVKICELSDFIKMVRE